MKKVMLSIAFIASIFILTQCDQKKSDETMASSPSDKVMPQLSNPNFGGFDSKEEWGKHLVLIGGCNDCHTPKKMGPNGPELDNSLTLSGHPSGMPSIVGDIADRRGNELKGLTVTRDLTEWAGPWGVSYSANLTPDPTGIGNWQEENLKVVFREGKFKGIPSSRSILPPMPWEMFKNLSDHEISAIFAYLMTLKPINNVVPSPLPPASAEMPATKKPATKKK